MTDLDLGYEAELSVRDYTMLDVLEALINKGAAPVQFGDVIVIGSGPPDTEDSLLTAVDKVLSEPSVIHDAHFVLVSRISIGSTVLRIARVYDRIACCEGQVAVAISSVCDGVSTSLSGEPGVPSSLQSAKDPKRLRDEKVLRLTISVGREFCDFALFREGLDWNGRHWEYTPERRADLLDDLLDTASAMLDRGGADPEVLDAVVNRAWAIAGSHLLPSERVSAH
jgi:hypothetical protein